MTSPAPEGLAGQETVERWLRSYDAHWDVRQSDGETRSKLEVLARFCAACGRQPDELVAWLFRPTPEGPRIRRKRRSEVMALIDRFEAENGGRAAGNTVRSFLIHNGVALSAAPLR
jgi:predicted Fe-S protein YdhL (DUF1289 family)